MLLQKSTYIETIQTIQKLCSSRTAYPVIKKAVTNSSLANNASAVDAYIASRYIPTLCDEGYTGPLCSRCADGWGRIRHTECTKCIGKKTNTVAYALIVVLNMFSLALTIRTAITRTRGGAMPYYSQIVKARLARCHSSGYHQMLAFLVLHAPCLELLMQPFPVASRSSSVTRWSVLSLHVCP